MNLVTIKFSVSGKIHSGKVLSEYKIGSLVKHLAYLKFISTSKQREWGLGNTQCAIIVKKCGEGVAGRSMEM